MDSPPTAKGRNRSHLFRLLLLGHTTYIPVRLTERAIANYGDKTIGLWAYFKARAENGYLYGWQGVSVTGEKFGFSRSAYFLHLKTLQRAGLLHKSNSHKRLATRKEVVGTNRIYIHVAVEHDDTLRDVIDKVRLKSVEQHRRQVLYRILPPKSAKERAKRERVELLLEMNRKRSHKTPTKTSQPLLGEANSTTVKRCKKGFAPMNTKKLMRATELGRSAMFAWKRRVKSRGLLKQINRVRPIPTKMHGIPRDSSAPDFEREFRGAFVHSVSMGWTFCQSSCYKTPDYHEH